MEGKKSISKPPTQTKSVYQGQDQQTSGPSNSLALPGPKNAKNPENGGTRTDLVVGPTIQPKGCVLFKNYSTSSLMERIPSRWPRPQWCAPWKITETNDKSIPDNLSILLDIQLPGPPDVQKNDKNIECGICYAQCLPIDDEFGENSGTDYTCDNRTCSRALFVLVIGCVQYLQRESHSTYFLGIAPTVLGQLQLKSTV